MEGVGGRIDDEDDATAEADEGGLTGVLLLKERKGIYQPGLYKNKCKVKYRRCRIEERNSYLLLMLKME